jgi:outer membrane protein
MTFAAVRRGALAVAAFILAAHPLVGQGAPAQPRVLSLSEALHLASAQSEAVRIAQAGLDRAHGQEMQARSQYLPQLSGSLQYQRTLKSQFSALAGSAQTPGPGTPPAPPRDTTTFFQPCTRYLLPNAADPNDRVRGLEQYARCASSGGIDFTKVGFGAANQYTVGLAGSLNLYTGGRVGAQTSQAEAGRRSADIELASQRAQLTLDVTQAYYDAVLSDRLVAIAESSLVQTETALRQTKLARQVGNQSEFELLRAQVTRDNQVPGLLQRRTDREIAYLRLKQILNLPYADSLHLTDDIGDTAPLPAARSASATTAAETRAPTMSDTNANARATVRQLDENIKAQEAALKVTRAERLPNITLSSQYGRVAFPSSGVPSWNNFLTNWTVTVGASVPLFTGGRIRGGEIMSQANLAEAKARLDQTRKLAALDSRQAVAQLEEAEASMAASAGTAQQATRAYSIAEVRYREGISTSLELSDSRILLQQALANRAMAGRDLQVARVRLALLKDLPLGASSSSGGRVPTNGGGAGAPGAAGGGAQQQQQSQPRAQAAGATGTGQ